ncbi:hypothetical protein TUZN_1924 [Thermoproteus uzoniensis 768-20]|uniref:Uncharacterized protein n=1 Tax=Thermoproteus uzoniensis (strain 768-20) TaxID=999630 RepID=F2L4F1_THEU7|nr:hypothetical protein TUZN_1924 [Thermoproteus uzoniensis 768-20]
MYPAALLGGLEPSTALCRYLKLSGDPIAVMPRAEENSRTASICRTCVDASPPGYIVRRRDCHEEGA